MSMYELLNNRYHLHCYHDDFGIMSDSSVPSTLV